MKFKVLFAIVTLSICTYSQNKSTYTYAIKNKDTLKLDVYKPNDLRGKDRLPVVLWMHGGGFSGGKRDNPGEIKFMEYLNTKNYIGISISYRLLRNGKKSGFGCNCPKDEKIETFKQAVIDYLDATKFVIQNHKKLNVDVSRIIAGGSSAGAEAILNAVYMNSFFVNNPKDYKDVKFAGVLACAGALLNASYINDHNAIPTVLFHGTADNLVPFGSAPHHYCNPEDPGYLLLDGSSIIAEKLQNLKRSFYFLNAITGKHEWASIPFEYLEAAMVFLDKTINGQEIIQTKKIIKQ